MRTGCKVCIESERETMSVKIGDVVQVNQTAESLFYMGGDVGVVVGVSVDMVQIDFNDMGVHVVDEGVWWVGTENISVVEVD